MLVTQQLLPFTPQKLKEGSKFIIAKQRIQLLIVKLKNDLQNKKNKNQSMNMPKTALSSQDFAACLSVMEMEGRTQQCTVF